MKQRVFLQDLLQTQSPLFSLICRYEQHFLAQQVHPSRVEGMGPRELIERLLENPRIAAKLNQQAFEMLGIEPDYDYPNVAYRLALLPQELMHRLILWTGSALMADRIRLIIAKDERVKILELIGQDAYEFAIKRALLLKHLFPEPLIESQEPMPQAVVSQGKRCLECALGQCPQATGVRLQLKFPESETLDLNQQVGGQLRLKAWTLLYRILTKELAPELALCFA